MYDRKEYDCKELRLELVKCYRCVSSINEQSIAGKLHKGPLEKNS